MNRRRQSRRRCSPPMYAAMVCSDVCRGIMGMNEMERHEFYLKRHKPFPGVWVVNLLQNSSTASCGVCLGFLGGRATVTGISPIGRLIGSSRSSIYPASDGGLGMMMDIFIFLIFRLFSTSSFPETGQVYAAYRWIRGRRKARLL